MHSKVSIVLIFFLGFVSSYPRPNEEVNPEEIGGFFEGDMILTEEQMANLRARNGLLSTNYRWPNKIVPYVFLPGQLSQAQQNAVRAAMYAIEDVSCVRFVPRTNQADYVQVRGDGPGCNSNVGRIRGPQKVNLQASYPAGQGCYRKFTIAHELLHSLGFYHMQSSWDRDNYVEIVWDNIEDGRDGNFVVYGDDKVTHFGVPYDYGSVMHYGRYFFSANGMETIIPIQNKTAVIGQRDELSAKDILRINKMYNC